MWCYVDFDGDKKLDLVMLDQDGFLTFGHDCDSMERVFIDEDNQPLKLAAGSVGKSGRVYLTIADWDGDSRLDVIAHSENAAWCRNCKTCDGGGRYQLSIAISHDGLNWTRVIDLEDETGAEFCYPSTIRSSDERVHVMYTWKRRGIKHAVLDPTKLLIAHDESKEKAYVCSCFAGS